MRGLLRQYAVRMTGLSRAQVTAGIAVAEKLKRRNTAGMGSRAASRMPISRCWRQWTKRMRR